MISSLEYHQLILEKVSFDPVLFEKELRKAIGLTTEPEGKQLRRWCLERFPVGYHPMIRRCFRSRPGIY